MPIQSLQEFSDQLAALIENASKFVVRVDARQRIAGTGIIWANDAILTADHVIEREDEIQVSLNGTSFSAEIAGRDPSTDIAALRIKGATLTPALVGDPKTLKAGHLVIAIGRPWSPDTVVSVGTVSARGLGWLGRQSQFREGLIQADVILYPGFSGGPLVDASGRVVGMNTSVLGRGMALAVPADTLSRVMTALLQEGRVRRGHLGVGLQVVPLSKPPLENKSGLMILTIEQGSAAEKAGLLPGDILFKIGGQTLESMEALQRYLSSDRIGSAAKVGLVRGGEIKEIEVVIGSR